MYRNISVIEELVILLNLIHIGQILGRPACIFQRPVIIPVKNNSHLCFIYGSQRGIAQLLQLGPQLLYLPEYPGILRPRMCNDRAMEFFTGPFAAAQLEKLYGIRSPRQRLIALRPHLARTFQGIVLLPVLLAGRLLHKHEGSIL